MGNLFSPPSPPSPPPIIIPAPPPLPPPPSAAPTADQVAPTQPVLERDSPAVQAKREAQEAEIRRRAGRQSTILSGALGDTSAAPIARRMLMGG